MKRTIETIASLKPERGEVFVVTDGRRFFLADCDMTIDIKQRSTRIYSIGSMNARYRNTFASVVFCFDLERSGHCVREVLERAENYEISCEFRTGIGESEKVTLEKFSSADVDMFSDEWMFEIEDRDTVRKLLSFR